MASQSVGPIARWFQKRVTTLYESVPPPEQTDFKALFSSMFSENAKIYVNHEAVPQETFMGDMTRTNSAHARAEVDWKEVMEVPPKSSDASNSGGIVAGLFVVTRSMKIRIRAGPAQRLSYNTFSAKVDEIVNGASDEDRFRISQLFLTTVEKAAPIHITGAPTHSQAAEPLAVEKS